MTASSQHAKASTESIALGVGLFRCWARAAARYPIVASDSSVHRAAAAQDAKARGLCAECAVLAFDAAMAMAAMGSTP